MSEIKGKLVTCNRCGTETFLKFVEHRDMDGGFSPGYDVYENLPDEWLHETEFGHLCPACAREFRYFIDNFMYGKVAPKWKIEQEDQNG